MKAIAFTVLSFFVTYNYMSQKAEYLGLTYEELLKKEGVPVDIIVNEANELPEDLPKKLKEKAFKGVTTTLVYDYDKSYFFTNGVVTGYGYGFTDEEERLNAKKEFEEKYINK